ncbi:MAG TPA: hypothetical protein VFM88_13875 [Vicinamibacteria bacterium]|nr:hypothetical protein [Vicinamibacteria bacterium]
MKTALVMLAVLCAAPRAWTQSASFTDVPDRFLIEGGGFNVSADTSLRFSSARLGGTTIDFEDDLDVPDVAQRGYFDAYWRAGRRHLLNLGVARLHREGPGRTLSRDIAWGDTVYPVGVSLRGRMESDHVFGAYRFAAYRNDRFEIGPSLGFGYLWITAGLRAEGTGQSGVSLDREATTGSVTGDLGGYLQVWAAKRLLVRGDMRYIFVKPERAEASVTEGRVGATYYPWPKVGFGAQYTYTKFRYDRDIVSSELSGSYRYSGPQLLVSFAF